SRFREMNDPSEPLAHGAMILFSGALLLTPGFFTDFIGFLLLVPNIRTTVFQKVRDRINIQKANFETRFSSSQNVYEGEYEPVSNPENSPWVKETKTKD
ncbi:MAG: FxsA family protein, partial [Rhodobacteraceae bacterium]|nr:FxsA family protein [Paracoccaceae bacterium]